MGYIYGVLIPKAPLGSGSLGFWKPKRERKERGKREKNKREKKGEEEGIKRRALYDSETRKKSKDRLMIIEGG